MAATGGVVGVNGLGLFLGDGAPHGRLDRCPYRSHGKAGGPGTCGNRARLTIRLPTARRWTRQRAQNTGLPAHTPSVKDDFLPPSILPQVGEQLRSLGYKESSIRAIMSENFMRVASQVWAR